MFLFISYKLLVILIAFERFPMKLALAKVLQKTIAGKKYTMDRLLKNE